MKISVITAVRNGAGTIRDCIESIRAQSVSAEHIVIDGVSTDGTQNIIREYGAKLISEPDKGIYDAMNKGLALTDGDVIGILNSDDAYAHSEVLAKVSTVFSDKGVDSCYGDLVYTDHTDTSRVIRYWQAGNYYENQFYRGWMPPHPTFFVRRSVYEKYGCFNLALGSAADYELMLRFLLRYKISTAYIPDILIRMRVGGVSNLSFKNRILANQMDHKAWKVNGLTPYWWTLYMKPLRKIGQYFKMPK
ncbi:MAG: glycosyl transferase [Desulfobacteraceae bacterium IS3]|jgi:glycosyltransferase|nr:MAG: glycosyl transferase [Desulfobacteraceae bacterium IS3]HAO20811.1 glycosyl transferase [Desulfobacteraceae bacterium]